MVACPGGGLRESHRALRGNRTRIVGCRAARLLSDQAGRKDQTAKVTAVVLDTNGYAALFAGEPTTVRLLSAAQEIHLPLIVLGELLAGFAAGTRVQKNRDDLARFMASPSVHVMRLDEKTPHFYADIFVALRNRGTPIPTNDMWIAALACQHRLPLLSFDAHFGAVPGLVLVDQARS